MRITLDALSFERAPVPDANGITWMATGLEGWESPALRQGTVEPTSRHGAVPTMGMLGTRALNLNGVVKAANEDGYWKARNLLSAATNNIYGTRTLTAYEGTYPMTLEVVRAGENSYSQVGVCAFEFTIPLLAYNPLKYGPLETFTLTAGSSVTRTVAGTFPTERITVETGGTVQFTRGTKTLRASNVTGGTIFDVQARTAMAGTVSQFTKILSASQWPDFMPGDNDIVNGGTQTAIVSYYPAFL